MVSIQSKGEVSCRLEQNNNLLDIYINNQLDYIDLSWGNYQRNILLEGTFKGENTIILQPNFINN